MNTIYWLSVMSAITGFFVFMASVIGTGIRIETDAQFQMAVENHQYGKLAGYRWNWLVCGIISTVIFLTI